METKFFKPLKVKKTCIDLRCIGALEQHEEALARTKALDLATMMSDERGELVHISGAPEVKSPPPSPYVREKVDWAQVILSAISIKQYLP